MKKHTESNTALDFPSASVLRAAAAQLGHEGAWTQNADARDAEGNVVSPFEATAASWSAAGMLARVAGEWRHAYAPLYWLRDTIGMLDTAWNDAPERTAQEVVAALNSAAFAAESRSSE